MKKYLTAAKCEFLKKQSQKISLPRFTMAEVFSTRFAGQRKAVFTLAEVLITLGIIGIVAAMTLPGLTARHRSKVLETQFWKRYNEVSQALLMIKRDGMPLYGNYAGPQIKPLLLAQFKGATDGGLVTRDGWDKIILGRKLPNYKTIDKSQNFLRNFLDDGTIIVSKEFFIFLNSDRYDTTNIQFVIDINGFQDPNIAGYDLFAFQLNKDDVLQPVKHPTESDSKHFCNPKSSAAGNQNGWTCCYYAMNDKDYFKNLNW